MIKLFNRKSSVARQVMLVTLVAMGLGGSRADAQCQVLRQPTKFDPPGPLTPADMFGRQDSMAIATAGPSPRLIVRYSYGFVTYSLASPIAPTMSQVHSLKSQEGYPKNGDGLERTGPLGMSADGARAVIPWGDVSAFGTVGLTYTANGFSGGGDFAPEGASVTATAVARVGSRYLGFSTGFNTVVASLYAADLTNIPTGFSVGPDGPKLTIASEKATSVSLGGDKVTTLRAVEGSSSWLLAASASQVTVVDVSGAGAGVPGLTTGFTAHSYSLSALGISSGQIQSMSGVAHPTDGSLYLLVEAAVRPGSNDSSTGVSLTRIDPATGSATVLGTYVPPTGGNTSQVGSVLVALDTDVAAVFLEGKAGGGLDVHVHPGTDFTRNLATGLTFTTFNYFTALAGFRSTGNSIYLYIGRRNEASYAASLSCATAPAPATATMTVERILKSGTVEQVAPGGTVYVGDTLRLKPAYSPPDTVQPLLDWRLDYDNHAGNATELSPTAPQAPQLVSPDTSKTLANGLPATQYTLVGPCDPRRIPDGGGPAPNPLDGTGCWASVTTNGAYTDGGQPDFPLDPAPVAGSKKLLTIAFEAANALNGGTSALATQSVNWEVPAAVLKSTALLAGGKVEVDPQGWPADTGYKWYFATTPVGQAGEDVLTLRADPAVTGATVYPPLTQAGTYRYWVSVPYRNGFATPDCPGLNGTTCSGDAAKTVQVTDVVLGFTVPPTGFVGSGTVSAASSSIKAATATPCGGTSGFTYDVCTLSGGICAEGSYSGTGLALVGDPFSGGSLTIPNPGEGTWGIRLKYAYTTTGSCTTGLIEAKWPGAAASPAWAPITIVKATPTIRLRNSSNTADITYQPGFGYTMPSTSTARAYAYLNGVQDPTPPAGMQWNWTNQSSQQTSTFGTGQGATLSSLPVGTYTIELAGYAVSPAPVTLDVSSSGGGGGSTALSVTSISVSPVSPVLNQSATVTCNATGGTGNYTYSVDFGDGSGGSSRSNYHSWGSLGSKTISCTVTDTAMDSDTLQKGVNVVDSGSTGTCDIKISGASGVILPYQETYYVTSGQQLTLTAQNATGTISWDYGDGQSGSGSSVTHVYVNAGAAEINRTLRMTAGSCSKSYVVAVSPAAGPSFSISDAGTGAALEWSVNAYKATAGQNLKFTSTGTTGTVSWDFGDGTSSSEASPVKAYAPVVDTTYVVKLSDGSGSSQQNLKVAGSTGAALTGNYTVTYSDNTTVNRSAVEPNKPIRFTGVDQATTYTWDFGDGSSVGTGSPVLHSFTRGGAFTVRLSVTRDGVPGTVTTASPLLFTVKNPPDPLLWVAGGMAYADGQSGERWQSDLTIFNPGTDTATFSLAFVSVASWNGAPADGWITEAIPAGQTKSFPNVLDSLFRLPKGSAGVVLVRGDDIPTAPVIVGRTYNAAGAGTVGTFGLSVPAMSVANGVRPQSAAGGNFLAGLRHDGSFRTNLIVANLKDDTAEVEIVFRGADGAVLGSPGRIIVEGRGVKQLNSALSADPPPAADQAGGAGWKTPTPQFSAEIRIKRGSGVYPYATVIDSGTGDSIVITPAPRPSAASRLPGIVRTATWKSDVSVLNPTANPRRVKVTYSYVRGGTTARVTLGDTLTFAPWQTLSAVDFVKAWLGLPDGDQNEFKDAFVDVAPASDDANPTDPLIIVGKTYTASAKGSSGLQVDAAVFEDGIGAQAASKRILLSGLHANASFRTNVALYLTPGASGTDAIEVDVHVFDSRGREQRSIWVRLDADNPVKQLGSSELFAGLTTTDAEPATIVIRNPRGAARLGAYATVIDNLSSDATFVAGQPVP